MDRKEFGKLYVNANSIADLALKQEFAGMEKMLSGMDDRPKDIDGVSSEADLAGFFDSLDLSIMDGLVLPEEDLVEAEDQAAAETPVQVKDSSLEMAAADISKRESSLGFNEEGAIDISGYLDSAYNSEIDLGDKIDLAFGAADLEKLQILIDQLPAEGQEIKGRLTAYQMERWLEKYKANESGLTQLVVEIRQLDINC